MTLNFIFRMVGLEGRRTAEFIRECRRREGPGMIVCHCQAVTDRAIRLAVRGGARSRREVALACAANLRCGGCAPVIDEIIASESDREDTRSFDAVPELAAVS